MKLARTQRAAIAILIPAIVITFLYTLTTRQGPEKIIDAMLFNTAFGLPPLIDVTAKIGFISLVVLVLHPIVKIVFGWIKRG